MHPLRRAPGSASERGFAEHLCKDDTNKINAGARTVRTSAFQNLADRNSKRPFKVLDKRSGRQYRRLRRFWQGSGGLEGRVAEAGKAA